MSTPPDDPTGPRGHVAPAPRIATTLSAPLLCALFADASSLLQRHVRALNAINVFPVPDGDTGTNMHLTLRAAVDDLAGTTSDSLSEAAQALAHGALMGARGNSGVILSQILRGFAGGLHDRAEADGSILAAAFAAGAQAAEDALSEPVEGTILTVMRDAAQAVVRASPATIEEVLACAVPAANASVERTPELLPALKEAGVVDAGGLGLAIIFAGLLRSLRGEPLDVDLAPVSAVEAGWRKEAASLHVGAHDERGYCTEFIVGGRDLEPASVRAHLSSFGGSLLVVGGNDLLRVHLHTAQPDEALAYGRSLGEVSHVKVDNLEAQIQRFVQDESLPTMPSRIGIVAVAAGDGIEAAFRSVGVAEIVHGGQTMNPSASEILAAIDACPAEEVLVLPNNKNIIAAAEQAAEQSSKRAAVVPSRSIPQGVAAALARSQDLPFEANTAAMERALASVRSAEVTRAVRPVTIDGRRVEVGEAIGVIDGSLRVVADSIASAAQQCVDEMLSNDASLLTLYSGAEMRAEDAEALARDLRLRYPALEVELVHGGQPHYPLLLSVE